MMTAHTDNKRRETERDCAISLIAPAATSKMNLSYNASYNASSYNQPSATRPDTLQDLDFVSGHGYRGAAGAGEER